MNQTIENTLITPVITTTVPTTIATLDTTEEYKGKFEIIKMRLTHDIKIGLLQDSDAISPTSLFLQF